MSERSRLDAARWRLRRLQTMDRAEILDRTRRTALHRLDDVLFRRAGRLWERSWRPRADDFELGRAPEASLGFLTRANAEHLRAADADGAAALVEAAKGVLEGRYRFGGHPELRLDEPLDDRRDPFTGERWPATHGKRLDYRGARYGDPKWIWDLNRLQELPLLAAAWLLTSDRAFLDHAVSRADAWVSASRPGRGIAWSNGYEAGLRGISLSLLLDAVRGEKSVPEEFGARVATSLWQHARWILRDPSTHSSANNHRVGELAGLVTIALLAPELAASGRWLDLGLAGLARESTLQIEMDGTGVEQAFGYHLHTLDLLLVAAALLQVTGRPVPRPLRAALSRSADALSVQLGDGEPEPRYGDRDDAWVVRLTGGERRDGRAVASTLAAFLGHEGARRAAGASLDVTARWLLGHEGTERFEQTTPAAEPGSVLLPDGGIVVLRSPGRRVLMDVGPLGYLSIAAHGHADALSITLAEDGVELVTDPGVGSYFAQPRARDTFRGTPVHATVAVDDLDQSVGGGPFLWRTHACTRLLHLDLDEGIALAEHDGYERLEPPVGHRRLVVAVPDGPVVVHDSLLGGAGRSAVQSWPLHPSLDLLDRDGDGLAVGFGREGHPTIRLHAACSAALHLELSHGGSPDPRRGWYSEGLEHVEAAWSVGFRTSLSTAATEIACVLWNPEKIGTASVEIVSGATGGSRVRYLAAGKERVLELRPSDVDAPVLPVRPG